jgi:hypothetical protein
MRPRPLTWLAWLLAVAASFALLESLAFRYADGITLSRTIYDANQAFPLIGPLLGVLFGGLLVHFFWHWDPAAQERIKALEAELAECNRQLERLTGRASWPRS